MMIGIVLETMQKESVAHDLEQGEGEAADIKALRQGMSDMQTQLKRMETLLNSTQSKSSG